MMNVYLTTLLPAFHIGPSGSDQFSTWLLGVTAGFVLAVAINKVIRLKME